MISPGTFNGFSESAPDGLVFAGEKSAQLRRGNFIKVWAKALAKAGLPKIQIHDLRYTGNTLAAATGATLEELMTRMGHSQHESGHGLFARRQGQGSCDR
ncbi:hypothetical protein [Nonomuraea sp. CA-141351]|uniref:hypothetical protein n=1 Tax=Nonomuraea sp. CA-141351 TaxID=3239996 RepID=UPI003D8A1972